MYQILNWAVECGLVHLENGARDRCERFLYKPEGIADSLVL